ncbi:MAG: VacB/RNase II family 3'-5' exoribonuclease [Firmicutes bacterium]|nr:VacB/RNase II family 3'-5' exoribonuclease [Bacillota bacterium]
MEEIVNSLEKLFSKDSRYHNKNEIIKALKIKGEEQQKVLDIALNILIEDGIIFFDKKYGYKIFPTNDGFAFGELEINKAGCGFVHTSNGCTILIENCDLNGALNGDNVVVNNIFAKRKDYYSGEIYKITKRKTGNIIFEVIGNGMNASIVPYNINEYVNVDINNNEFKNLIDGDLILVNVGCESNNGVFKGTINKVLGHIDDPNIDIKLIAEKHNIPTEFSNEVIDEANLLPTEVSEEDLINRVDLREENIFTIDCDKTKDRDDAVGIKKLENGNFLLKVSIAHVSHYIKSGTKLFEEALNRCSSHYPGNTCIPMLPHIISNGICSLNPNVDRLTRTVEMEINSNGEVIDYSIYPSVINSKMAMSYSNVNKVLNGEYIENYDNYKEDLKLMEELNNILNKAREKRNYINFDTLEMEAEEDNKGNIIEFKRNNYGTAGQIIENFMLLANTTVYSDYSWQTIPYRVHDYPNEEKIKEVINILRASNIDIPKLHNVNSYSLKKFIDDLDDSDLSFVIKESLLKSQSKAKYDINNIGHFALQYDIYGHFTSPIRRIIDLLMHTIIDNVESFDYSEESIKSFENFLSEMCKRANNNEKLDKLLEEETLDMLMAKYMEDKIGEEYSAIITNINKHCMIVRTENFIKGKVKLENMLDDKYYYDYDKKAIMGRSSKNKYQIGNKIVVLVKDASKNTRTVNFEIPKEKVLKK